MPLPNFQNPALLRQALTHSSYANEHPNEGPDYDRLEFLGDGILELVVRDLIFARYPHLAVGEMSQRCDRLVDEHSLAELAVKLGIPNQMRLGAGSQHERHNPSVQADMVEAVIGAYRLDSGLAAAYSYVEQIISPLIDCALDLRATDPVTELQEYVQAHMGGTLPTYLEKERLGPDHAKVFILEVWAGGTSYGVGQGRSIKEARKNAAIAALRTLKP